MLGREEWHSRTTQVFFQVRSEGENSLFAPGPKTALGVGSNSTAVTTRPTKHGQIQRFVFPFFFFFPSLLIFSFIPFPSFSFFLTFLHFFIFFCFALIFFFSFKLFISLSPSLSLFLSFLHSLSLSPPHHTTRHFFREHHSII